MTTPPTAGPRNRHPDSTMLSRFGKGVPRERGDFTWVYLWGAPLRVMHWIAALCIVALVLSGLYIGRPYFATTGEASSHFMMGRFRFTHFAAAAVIVMTGIVRAYWLFAGNAFERFPALFPLTPKNMSNMFKVLRTYLNFRTEEQPHFIGHNPLAQWAYTSLYALMVVMVVTGFTLYGQSNPEGLIFKAFGWVPALLGGLQGVRLIHHALTWAFLIFLPIHIYLAVRADYVERAGVVSSILTGGRFVASNEKFEDIDVQAVKARPWPHEG
jgi:Ni/Fe-hydrogenase b-type cytochrome subunit